jgi:Fanconi anemia group M protein
MVTNIDEFSEYFEDEFIKDKKIHFRKYQNNIVKRCGDRNSLVVLPTGLGKTIIGVLLIAHRFKKYPRHGKVLILAPTRPLVAQHLESCEKFIDIDENKINLFTGKIPPEKRLLLFNKSQIIISTPQVIKNDLMRGRYDLGCVSLIIFDEAHRTKGNYAYNFLSKEYMKSCSDPLILGLTASFGKNYETIQELCDNLFIENVIFRTYEDEDVSEYIHDIDIFLKQVDLPIKVLELSQIIESLFERFLRFFIERDLIQPHKRYYSKLDFLRIAQDLTITLKYGDLIEESRYDGSFGQLTFTSPKIIDIVREKQLNIHSIFSYCSSCISLLHAKELLETQDIRLFINFLERLKYKSDQDNLSAKRITHSDHFQLIDSLVEQVGLDELSHPKIQKVLSLLHEEIDEYDTGKILIFTQYREMADFLKDKINFVFKGKLSAEKFIGQTSKMDDKGFTQTKQINILHQFRRGEINVLTATSVAEEGLDIPNVDAIIFYEPVASEIRLIQRRGRTGRHSSGRCYILIANDTLDSPFFRVSKRKEETMNSVLRGDGQNLDLAGNISRSNIDFKSHSKGLSDFEVIKKFRNRREREKELLANRSIEEICEDFDKFSQSEKYQELKNCGVSFFSDVANINKTKIKQRVLKMKGKTQKKEYKKRKQYINNNVKTLIRLVETYNENDRIAIEKLQELAEFEEIEGKKFYIHLNRACYLGYLKRGNDFITLLKEL